MRVAVCDDDAFELKKISSALIKIAAQYQMEADIKVDTFASPDALLLCLEKQSKYDLMILDILMPGMNGIELAKEMRLNGDHCRIIYLTSTPEFAVDSYKVNAYYYLLKPWSEDELSSLVIKVLHEVKTETDSSVIVKSRGKLTRLLLGAIRYIESDNHKVRFFLRDNETVDCLGSLADFHAPLLCDKRFVNCHKSYIVNMDYISSISGKDFVLNGNERIPISRNAYVKAKSTYFDYFLKMEMNGVYDYISPAKNRVSGYLLGLSDTSEIYGQKNSLDHCHLSKLDVYCEFGHLYLPWRKSIFGNIAFYHWHSGVFLL